MALVALCNFRANGIHKNKGEPVSQDELKKIGVAGAAFVGSDLAPEVKAPEAPKEEPSIEEAKPSEIVPSGKKKKKGE